MHRVKNCVFKVKHLQYIACLDESRNNINAKLEKLNDRPGRLTFFHFRCKIDSVDIDSCIRYKNPTLSSVSVLPNTSIISPPGLSIPSSLTAKASKRLRGVKVVWLPYSEACLLLELASVLIFLMLIPMQCIIKRNPAKNI